MVLRSSMKSVDVMLAAEEIKDGHQTDKTAMIWHRFRLGDRKDRCKKKNTRRGVSELIDNHRIKAADGEGVGRLFDSKDGLLP